MAPMPLRVTRMLDEVSIKDIELLYSASLEWLPRCVKYCQGKPTRRLFIPFNQRNQPPTRSLAMIHRSSRTEISNSSGNSPASNYEIEWPAFESVRERKKGSDRGGYRVPVREIISRYFDARNAAKVCARIFSYIFPYL